MADDTGKIQKGAMDAAVQAFKLEKERVSQQRIALENQKEVTKQTKELSQETEGIQGKFASLVDNLSKVNASMAIAAARQKQSNKGTFESIITMRQVNKVTKDLEKDGQLIAATKRLTDAKQKQAEEIEKDGEIYAARNRIEQIKLDQEKEGVNRIALEEEKTKLISDISSRETTIKAMHLKDIEEAQESELKAIERGEGLLKQAGKAEGYNKFSDGLKELSGGIIDVAGTLDMGVTKITAFADVVSGIASPIISAGKGIYNFGGRISAAMRGEADTKEELAEKTKGLSDTVLKSDKIHKKGNKNLIKTIAQFGAFGIIALALFVAFQKLKDASEGFTNFLNRWGFGESDNEPSQKQLSDQLQIDYAIDMEGARTQADKDRITAAYQEKFKAMLFKQDKRIAELKEDEIMQKVDTAMMQSSTYLTYKTNAALQAKLAANAAVNLNAKPPITAQTNPEIPRTNNNTPDKRTKAYKNALKNNRAPGAFSLEGLKKTATWATLSPAEKLTRWMGRGGVVVSVGMTGKQIYDEINFADDMQGALDELMFPSDGSPSKIDAETYFRTSAMIDRNMYEQIATQVTAAGLGAAASTYTFGALQAPMAAYAGPTLGGSYVVGGGASLIAGGVVYVGTSLFGDWFFDTDEQLLKFIANKNMTDIDYNDPDLAQKHYEMMLNEADSFISSGNLKLNELTNEELANKFVMTDEMKAEYKKLSMKQLLSPNGNLLLSPITNNNQSINFGSSQATSPSAEVCNIRDYPPGWTP